MHTMTNQFNTELFAEMLQSKRKISGQSIRDVAAETNVSSSTISRLERGLVPDVQTLFILCHWMNVSPQFFARTPLTLPEFKPHGLTRTEVIDFIRADKLLGSEAKQTIIGVINMAYNQK